MDALTSKKKNTIALLGQPNTGKSTLFNGLTGSRQHVGNWPGKTVEKKEGSTKYGGIQYHITDLPGSYSLSAHSDEEMITRDYIASGHADVVCIIADASQLDRSLFILADYAGIDCPAILLLNLMDVAKAQGKQIDVAQMEKQLGIPVVPFVATDKKHYDAFYTAVNTSLKNRAKINTESLETFYKQADETLFSAIKSALPDRGIQGFTDTWLAAKAYEGDGVVIDKILSSLPDRERENFSTLLASIEDGVLTLGGAKFKWIDQLLTNTVSGVKATKSATLNKLDRVATHPTFGKPLALFVLMLGLVFSFVPAMPIMLLGGAIPKLAGPLGSLLSGIGTPQLIVDFINQVVLNALCLAVAMIGFVFGVNLVFGIVEEVGYMARISYVFDNAMANLGLQGKAVMPFVVSFGCTIGGAAGTRVIDSWGQRVLTIALAWVIPCAATWSIVPVLSTLFFGAWAPLIIVLIFLVAWLHMLFTAKVFGPKLVRQQDRTGLIMELPPYHKPKWGALLRSILVRSKDILWRALKVIFTVSAFFWLVTYSASGAQDQTLLYRFGRVIEPVTGLFGMTWQTFIAYISSMISKEAALGVLSTLYVGKGTIFSSTLQNAGTASNFTSLLSASLTRPQALAFIFAVTFNPPCLMAISSTYQETRSLKWTLRITLYYIATSLILAFSVYHITSLFL